MFKGLEEIFDLILQNLASENDRQLLRHRNKAWLAAFLSLSTMYDYVKVR